MDTWDVEAIYQNIETWKQDIPKEPWIAVCEFKGKFLENFEAATDVYFSALRHLEKLYTWAHLKHDENLSNDLFKGANQQITALFFHFQEMTAWIEPELLAADEAKLRKLQEKFPTFCHYIDQLLLIKPHTLPADQEALLAQAGQPLQVAYRSFAALNDADFKFDDVEDNSGQMLPLTHALYGVYMKGQDRTLRHNTFKTLFGKFQAHSNTFGELLNGRIQADIFAAKTKKFESCLEAALKPKNIPLSVYHNLIEAVHDKLPALHKYMKLRKEITGNNQIYDTMVPLITDVEIEMNFETAAQNIVESVAPLGKEYQDILQKGLTTDRWTDRYEREGKRSGAYSGGCYDSRPYILMNYQGKLRDIYTLAHEAGHSMHSHLAHTHQPFHYGDYTIFVAEVASTLNEELLTEHLLKKYSSAKEQAYLTNEQIDDIRSTLFRQAMFAEFELKTHALAESGEPLTPTTFCQIYTELAQQYFGPDIEIDPLYAFEWARIPHFYYNFYVYQYATGISAALSLSKRIKEKGPEDYLNFLKGGSSKYSVDLLKGAGVDMTTKTPVLEALETFETLVDSLEKLIKSSF